MQLLEIARQLVIAAEVMGTPITEAAAEVMARELAGYADDEVNTAIRRCMREHTGRLTLAAILQRIDLGHLGPEEAWALCPRDESESVVWTDEISEAFGAARLLRASGDETAARMAFREAYTRIMQRARDERRKPRWLPSLGHDVGGREGPIREAVAVGRLPASSLEELPPPKLPRSSGTGLSTLGSLVKGRKW